MSPEADAICGAPDELPGPDRVNVRNGYRHRDFDTQAGTWTSPSRGSARAVASRTGCWNAAGTASDHIFFAAPAAGQPRLGVPLPAPIPRQGGGRGG
jgi:hypothetical protein